MNNRIHLMTRRGFVARLCGSLVSIALFTTGSTTASAQGTTPGAKPPRTVRLFTVGNSFSGDATRMLGQLTKAAGNVLIYGTGSIGGGSMQQHWEKKERHDRDPLAPEGLYSSKRSLRQELTSQPWDFVTIQQASILSHDPATYRPYAANLAEYIRTLAPTAELVIHQTWAYRADDPRFAPLPRRKTAETATQRAMYAGLTHAYETIATELGIRTIPVGDAFFRADTDPVWGFKPDPRFDPKTAVYPALPDQTRSLHVGWQWQIRPDGKRTIGMDGHHANAAGQYLGACVFYEFLFGESVENNTFVPAGMDPTYARFLRKTAHDAVAARRTSDTAAAAANGAATERKF